MNKLLLISVITCITFLASFSGYCSTDNGPTFMCREKVTGDNYFIELNYGTFTEAKVWIENESGKYEELGEVFNVENYVNDDKLETTMFFSRSSDDLTFNIISAPGKPLQGTTLRYDHSDSEQYFEYCYIMAI